MRVAVRVDASAAIGTGHLVRSLALAEEVRRRGGEVTFIGRLLPDDLAVTVREAGHTLLELDPPDRRGGGLTDRSSVLDADRTVEALGDRLTDVVVVDHYGLDAVWERRLREVASRIVAIDDRADRAHACDVLVDHNLHDDAAARYRGTVPDGCRLLLGPSYALLRRQFAEARRRAQPRRGTVRRILVSFGGGDDAGATALAVRTLRELGLERTVVEVVAGPAHSGAAEIERLCREHPAYLYRRRVDAMAETMLEADLAIGAAGISTWERCSVGLPAVVIVVADNQRAIAEAARREGVLEVAGDARTIGRSELAAAVASLLSRPRDLARMSERGLRRVDARGAVRVADEILGSP